MAIEAQEPPSQGPLAAAEERAREVAEPLSLLVRRLHTSPSRLSLRMEGEGGGCVFHVEKAREGAPYFRVGAGLRAWYSADDAARLPWLSGLLGPLADGLLATPHLAEALADPGNETQAEGDRFPRRTGLDLVRAGLKPATSILVGSGRDPRTDDLPYVAVSRLSLARDKKGDLVISGPNEAGASRMLYAGRDEKVVLRLRDLDEALVKARLTQGAQGSGALQEELGELLGYPACCTRAFALAKPPAGSADLHASLFRREHALHAIDPRQNHILAHFYDLPFLLHVPCREDCEATADLVDRAIEALYGTAAQRVVREVLSRGALVFPDDRVVFFKPMGAPEEGSVAVTELNVEPHPEALPGPREQARCVAKDAAPGARDAEVLGLALSGGRALVRVGDALVPYDVGGPSGGAPPLAIVPWRPA